MLSVPGHLPAGALLDDGAIPLTTLIAELGAHWFSFDRTLAEMQGDTITGLPARTGGNHARPTDANVGNARLIQYRGADVLATTPRTNCGFVLSERVKCETISVACVFDAPGGAGETLWCVDAKKGDRAVVLVERGGVVHLTDRAGERTVSAPLVPGGAMQVAFATLTDDVLSLIVGEAPAVQAQFPGSFRAGPADVFFACRRGRQGLLNTLGDLRLGDVILFPDRDICAPDAAVIRARLRAYAAEVFHGI
ncbi:hypothetical protein [Oceaniglobus ichthyenteri]|uniref:hypothetical protein n=1 Tax=Oceaniglobus ichthyenteri TaxID=2136177 RepID=UPI000D38147C|nr:hypothetical protein [Oceaniglobus ichthyenteri]